MSVYKRADKMIFGRSGG